MPDRCQLLRHALGELAINDVYHTHGGVSIVRASNKVYSLSVGNKHFRHFRMGRRISDASLWELTRLILELERMQTVDAAFTIR